VDKSQRQGRGCFEADRTGWHVWTGLTGFTG
jgi:hypothetical protein